ncbi:carbohydrate kinase family protein [Protaetiibacter larvae]|uniref:carbohydrate kinase family protein n=1 Tax=Protaetiibacter larvae TaxID=2592654 RepID=UPI00143D542E|nr:PfkB family carbohydrate kinase [Protaetiibacter larvae]
MNDAPARVVVIGDALIDELVDPSGTTRIVGGSALNVAVGLSVLGVPATLVAMVGDDADGALIREHLAAHGVLIVPTITAAGTGIARSERVGGEPRYAFSESMVARSLAFDEAQRAAIADAALVAVSGFPFDVPEQLGLLEDAVGASSAVVAVDPNPRPGLLHDREAYRGGLERFGAATALLKVGDDDTRLLYGTDAVQTMPRLGGVFPRLLVTRGEHGVVLVDGDSSWSRPTAASAVVDTMGAGDSVFATALAAIAVAGIDGMNWPAVLERCMAIAAATIAHPGALLRLPE